jgi:acetyl-CoA acetyltransferase family protein
MSRAVIVGVARTPIGRSRKGKLATVDAFRLAEFAVKAAIERSSVPTTDLEDIVLAESLQGGGVIARHTAIVLGLTGVPGQAVNRHCAGGLAAIQTAAAAVRSGVNDVVVAGGTESMSGMPLVSKPGPDGEFKRWLSPSHPDRPDAPNWDMSITVGENTAKLAGLTRADVDEWAVYSHGRAVLSQDSGWFEEEIVPVTVEGEPVTQDEQPRRGVTTESLAQLQVIHPEIAGATVTVGNAAGVNDAAAALMIVSEDYATAHGLAALGYVREWGVVAVDPYETGLAPIAAIEKALVKSRLAIGDIDRFEVNEAFNAVPVAVTRKLGIPQEKTNVNGSGCSLGHPVAATGARMVVTMLNELKRSGGTLGLVSMCAGGGMGSALVVERA